MDRMDTKATGAVLCPVVRFRTLSQFCLLGKNDTNLKALLEIMGLMTTMPWLLQFTCTGLPSISHSHRILLEGEKKSPFRNKSVWCTTVALSESILPWLVEITVGIPGLLVALARAAKPCKFCRCMLLVASPETDNGIVRV